MNPDAANVERLLLKAGEQPTAAHVNALQAQLDRQQLLRTGRGVRRRIMPWGTHEHFNGGSGGVISPYFEPSLAGSGDRFEVRWKRGLVGGVEPTIGDVPISGDKKTGVTPAFIVGRDAFNAEGEALVYFRLTLARDFSIAKVEPFASAKVPPLRPWTAHVLALLLFADGGHWRKLVANQGYRAINRRPDGTATHIFWAKF